MIKMGAVIGRGGSRISEIRMLSTQEIKIHEVEGESPVRRITVQGTKDQIDKAVLLLHVCVNVYTEPKDKVGHMQLLAAVQYAQNKDNEVRSMQLRQRVKLFHNHGHI